MTSRPLPTDIPVPPAVTRIVETLEAQGFEAWCVGGALRDAVLGLDHADFDVATSATPDRVRRLFRRTVAVGEKYGTVGVLDDAGALHEVTTFRQDVRTDGRHAEVAFGVSLEEDLARRDFTINAIAWHPLRKEWSDPFGGASDLGACLIRAVGDPVARVREDYLRVLRALRFAARLEFAIEPATWAALRDAAPGLAHLSAERVRDEWFKSLRTAARVSLLVSLWQESGAAGVLVPELDAMAGSEPELSRPPRDPVLLTSVLTGHPEDVLRRWRASNAEVARARAIMTGPARPAEESLTGVRRWLAATGAAADDLLRRHQLMHGSIAPWARDVDAIRKCGDPLSREALAVRGGDLVAMGLTGPAVGRMLDQLLERVLETPSLNTRDALLELARSLA